MSAQGEFEVPPYSAPPETLEGLRATVLDGKTVMWCDTPVFDGRPTAIEHLTVQGWAHCAAGIEAVVVTVDGAARHTADHGVPRPDLAAALDVDLVIPGFSLRLLTEEWESGTHHLEVVAIGRDGRAVGQAGPVTIDPDAAYRTWLDWLPRVAPPAGSSPPAPPLAVCVLGEGDAGDRLRHSVGEELPGAAERITADAASTLESVASAGSGYAVLADARGTLAPGSLDRLAAEMTEDPTPDLVYGDEDALVAGGQRGAPFLKPGWSPELLPCMDYLGPVVAVGPRAARSALAADPQAPTSVHDLAMRLLDAPLRVRRIAEPLFTCDAPRTPADGQAERRAVEHAAARRGRRVRVGPGARPGTREVAWEVQGRPRVSIVIPTTFARGLLRGCLASIRERSSYENLEIVLVDSSGGRLDAVAPLLDGLDHSVVPYAGPFNFSTVVNLGAEAATGDHLILLNDDTEVQTPDWIERMLGEAQTPGVGVVGAKLLYPDGRVQHAGVNVVDGAAGAGHLFLGLPGDASGYRGLLGVTRNCTAVTAACLMVGADLYRELGGFDEEIAVLLGDTDFCLRVVGRGLRVACTPHAVLSHHQSASRGPHADLSDVERFAARWGERYAEGDPLYHPALSPVLSYEFR